jgi:hypothetical protein
MAGGILQLIAKSVEDIFITNDPEITFFKVVYRRHTNFSKESKRIKFRTEVGFGSTCNARIRNYGDFIHTVYLVLNIPNIDIKFKKLLISDIKDMLLTNEIQWKPSEVDNSEITDQHLSDIQALINSKITKLTEEKTIIENVSNGMLTIINNVYNDSNISDENFFESLQDALLQIDPNYKIPYEFIKAYKTDKIIVDDSLITLPQLRSQIFNKVRAIVIPDDNTTFDDENIYFMDNIQRETFSIRSVDTGINTKSYFTNLIAELYTNDSQYSTYDSQKITNAYLTANDNIINNTFDISEVKNDIVNHIRYDLGKNVQLLIKIYNNLVSTYRFLFYRRFLYDADTATNSAKEDFVNLSTANLSTFDDVFTKSFTLKPNENEPDNITHYYSDYVQSYITKFHNDNKNILQTAKYKNYFNDFTLWSRLNINTVKTDIPLAQRTPIDNFYLLNFIPRLIIPDIYSSIESIITGTMETTGTGNANLMDMDILFTTIFQSLRDALLTEITVSDLLTDDDIVKLVILSSSYKKNLSSDKFVIALFKYYKHLILKNTTYNMMEYIKQIYINRMEYLIEEFDALQGKGIVASDLSWIKITYLTDGSNKIKNKFMLTYDENILGNKFDTSGTGNYFNIFTGLNNIKYTVWYDVDSGNTAPIVSNSTLIEVNISALDSGTTIVQKTKSALDALNDFTSVNISNALTITNTTTGPCSPTTLTYMPIKMTITGTTVGTITQARIQTIKVLEKSVYKTSDYGNYFSLYNANNTVKYYIWLKSGETINPSISNSVGLEVDISSATTASEVASAITTIIDANVNFTATSIGDTITITNAAVGISGHQTVGTSTTSNYITLMEAIKMFFMITSDTHSVSSEILPTYTKYKNNGYSLYKINFASGTFTTSLTITGTEATVLDVPSSIWYNIYNDLIKNYNDIYNNKILDNTYIDDYLGKNITEYKSYIDTNTAANVLNSLRTGDGDDYTIDYHSATSTQINKITNSQTGYLTLRLNNLNTSITLHDNNKNILNISQSPLSLSTKLFETYDIMIAEIQNIIYQTFDSSTLSNSVVNSGYEHVPETIQFDQIKTDLTASGIMNIINSMETIKNTYFDISNTTGSSAPSTLETYAKVSYNKLIKTISNSTRSTHKSKYDSLFSSISSSSLFNDFNNIYNNFNAFAKESDIYNYMLNILKKASIVSPVLSQKGISRLDTYNKVYGFYYDRLVIVTNILDVLNGTGSSTVSLYNTIVNMKTNAVVPQHAWIKHLGEYIINYTHVDIGGQIIDKLTGEYIHFHNDLSCKEGNIKGYNIMTGNVPKLYTYDRNKKQKTTLYIPLPFFFSKNHSQSLPIVALNHTYVDIEVKFKELLECSYWEDRTIFKKNPKLSGHLLVDYIYVEPEQRYKLVNDKHEILIDTIQYKDIHINQYNIDENGYYTFSTKFSNPTKEVLIAAQKNTYVDGTYLSPQITQSFNSSGLVTTTTTIKRKSPHYYGINENGTGCPIKSMKIDFNGTTRQPTMMSCFYNLVCPYKSHTRIPFDGLLSYPFCLYPELIQPSGSANLSKIDNIDFVFQFNDSLVNEMKINGTTLRIVVYAKSYNFLRVFSGMAGLAYYS